MGDVVGSHENVCTNEFVPTSFVGTVSTVPMPRLLLMHIKEG